MQLLKDKKGNEESVFSLKNGKMCVVHLTL